MNKQPKLVTALYLPIVYLLPRPSYMETDKGVFLEKHPGRFFRKADNELVPMHENTEDKLRREYPNGKNYRCLHEGPATKGFAGSVSVVTA